MNTGLDGRVAAVTGAGSGIGRAIALALADEGCSILASDIEDFGRDALAAITPKRCKFVRADVTVASDAQKIIDLAVHEFGRLDVLVTSAGIYDTTDVATVSLDRWDTVQSVSVVGTFLCARAAIPAMARHHYGRVITFGSMAAETGGLAAGPAYVAAKSAVMGLTRSIANWAGPSGVTVNCICPGIIETPMTAIMSNDLKDQALARTPMGRLGTPDDVATVAVMLASAGAGFITGAHIDVNGGLHMT